MPCAASSTPASRWTGPATTASARRSTCATPTTTASSSTGTGPATSGRAPTESCDPRRRSTSPALLAEAMAPPTPSRRAAAVSRARDRRAPSRSSVSRSRSALRSRADAATHRLPLPGLEPVPRLGAVRVRARGVRLLAPAWRGHRRARARRAAGCSSSRTRRTSLTDFIHLQRLAAGARSGTTRSRVRRSHGRACCSGSLALPDADDLAARGVVSGWALAGVALALGRASGLPRTLPAA